MMQTVRIFRRREDNFDAMILQEFFKFIGFLVTDFAIEDRKKWDRILSHKYDINVRLKVEEKLELLFEEEQEDSIWIIGNTVSEVFDELLKREELGLNSEPMHTIINFFKEKRFPAVIYNMQNMNFVTQEIFDEEKRKKVLEIRENAFQLSYKIILECYNKLIEAENKTKCQTVDPYVEYAVLNMKYIINLIFYLWKDDLVFDAVVISEYAERIELQYPEFICIQSLKGRILLHDNRHLIEAESRFIYASKKASKNHVPDELQALLRVEVYKFCEKVRKDMELANELQEKEYKNTKWHILENLYQNIKVCEKKKNWSEMIKLCNEMIVNVLNGRKIELLMPREQIDMYRVYSLLGKAYYEKSIYNLAIACYKMVIEIFETSLNYDEELSLIGLKVFADISKINMPEKKCYIELINCYSAYGDDKAIKECQKQLKETVWT